MIDRTTPAFLKYYARVCLREARARRGSPFATTLLGWAAKARREAMANKPSQGELFA